MDTLYLVFKHQFQIVLDCLTERINSPQANEDFNPVTQTCQAGLQLSFENTKMPQPEEIRPLARSREIEAIPPAL
jgi:hypothetical protein